MQKLINYLIFIFTCGILASCSSTTSIKIDSNPSKADIYATNLKKKTTKKLGQTPYILKSDDIEKLEIEKEAVELRVSKQGYEDQKIILTDTIGSSFDVLLKMSATKKFQEAESYDQLSSDLFETQRLIRTQDYDGALKLARDINKKFPELSVPLELMGSIYYFKKDYKQAFNYFDQAQQINPQNAFAQKMKNVLIKKFGKQ